MTFKMPQDNKQRQSAYMNQASYTYANNMMGTHTQNLRTNPYQPSTMMHAQDPMAALTQGFGAVNLRQPSYGLASRGSQYPAASSSEYGGVPVSGGTHAMYMPGTNHVLFTGPMQNPTAQQQHGLPYSPQTVQYMQYANYGPGHNQHIQDHSPISTQWNSRVPSGEMPTLITPRRDSISSNEQDLPGTPYTAYGGYPNAGFQVMDRSPSAVYAQSNTPSPSQLVPGYALPQGKIVQQPTIPLQLQMLIQKEPSIPRAIPAPSSPAKPLDRSLENKNGETNVYIRGLLPETTDDMLHNWGSRFGDIQSSKSIIDLKNNLCKG